MYVIVLNNILHRWLVPYAEDSLGDQCGFRQGQSTTDNLFMSRCIIDKFYELNLICTYY